jgi:hypothetical protein
MQAPEGQKEVNMKVENIKDIDKFFKVIDECKGKVELVTGEGDRLNLKSKLSQYVSMANIFSDGTIKELELVAYEPEDIDRLQMMRRDKLEGCALFIKSLDAEAAAIKAEEAALKERRQAVENKAARMRGYVLASMTSDPIEVNTPRCRVTVRKPSQIVVITDEAKLPRDMLRIKTEPDKTAIKEAIKGGATVEGAMLVENTSVIIK